MRFFTTTLALAVAVTLIGCSEDGSDTSATTTTTTTTTEPASPVWILASNPGGAQSVTEARAGAKEGDTITIRGIIGGRVDAMSDEAGVFIIMDETVPNGCVDDGGDHCKTPWDYCCTTQDEKLANSASIQLVGDDGRTIAKNLRDFGIEELDRVVIVGAVGARPTENVLNIRASGIFVESN